MDGDPESSAIDSALLMSFGVGLGFIALVLALVAGYLLLRGQDVLTRRKYRRTKELSDLESAPAKR